MRAAWSPKGRLTPQTRLWAAKGWRRRGRPRSSRRRSRSPLDGHGRSEQDARAAAVAAWRGDAAAGAVRRRAHGWHAETPRHRVRRRRGARDRIPSGRGPNATSAQQAGGRGHRTLLVLLVSLVCGGGSAWRCPLGGGVLMKTCPICGARAFDDAGVCFGCLHRFEAAPPPAVQAILCAGQGPGPVSPADPSASRSGPPRSAVDAPGEALQAAPARRAIPAAAMEGPAFAAEPAARQDVRVEPAPGSSGWEVTLEVPGFALAGSGSSETCGDAGLPAETEPRPVAPSGEERRAAPPACSVVVRILSSPPPLEEGRPGRGAPGARTTRAGCAGNARGTHARANPSGGDAGRIRVSEGA